MSSANENATPYAARLNFGSPRRAITAARNGPSTDIISQVAASGAQNTKIRRSVSSSVCPTVPPASG